MSTKIIPTLYEILDSMRATSTAELCYGIYEDALFYDNAIIMFHELGDFDCMHALMQELHDRLSAKLGYPVHICHNHPTDESVLVLSSKLDQEVYDRKTCCHKDTVRLCLYYLEHRGNFRPDIKILAEFAEDFYSRQATYSTVEELLHSLDHDKEYLPQLIAKDYGIES